jgi:dihydrofolate reductase
MGRNTWESLPFRPLPKRHNVVVSNTMREQTGVEVVQPDIYRSRCVTINMTDNVWIIGGAQLINNSLDIIDEIWLSRISGTYECDTFLPRSLIEELFTLTTSEKQNDVYVEVWEKR